jgi:hypothetical protein
MRHISLALFAFVANGLCNAQTPSDPLGERAMLFCKSRIGPREDNRFWLQFSSSGEIGVESKHDPRKLIPTELSQTDLKWTDGEDKYEFNRYSGVLSASFAPRWATMRKWYDCKKIGGRLF